eukprot:2013589-Amphidinium_carterae.1
MSSPAPVKATGPKACSQHKRSLSPANICRLSSASRMPNSHGTSDGTNKSPRCKAASLNGLDHNNAWRCVAKTVDSICPDG